MFEDKSEKSETELETPKIENATDKITSPESLAEQKISEMQDSVIEFEKDGMEQMKNANNLIGSDEKNALEIRANLGVDEKLSDISGRAKELFKKTMKRMVAIGMVTVAFYGAGKFEDNQDVNNSDNTKTTEWVNPDTGNSYEVKSRNEWLDPDTDESYKIKPEDAWVSPGANKINNAIPEVGHIQEYQAEKIKDELIEQISSQEYLEKLTREIDGDRQQAESIQKDRLNYLDSVESFFVNDMTRSRIAEGLGLSNELKSLIPQWLVKELGKNNIDGFYSTGHKIFLPANKMNYDTTRHEFLHASTKV